MDIITNLNLNTPITGLTCGILSIMLIVSYFILFHKRVVRESKAAPEAQGAWPIVGHLLLLGGAAPPHRTLGAMADKYGSVFTIRLGTKRALVVSDCEMAKQCFTINDNQVSSRPKLVASEHIGYNHVMFGFAPYGAYWREMRKLITLQLLSNRRLQLLKHIRVSEVRILMKQLYGFWNDQEKNASGQALVEMKQQLGGMTLNVILRMVVGKRYSVGQDVGDEKESRKVQIAIREAFRLLGSFVPGDAIPYIGWLDFGGYEKDSRKTAKELDDALENWLQEHKRKRDGGGHVVFNEEQQDFMDVMLSVLKDYSHFDADTINKSTSLNLILGGTDTTTIALTWAVSLLLNNRHTLKKAKDELDSVVGQERVVEESDISKLEYIQAIVKEMLRLYPASPLSGPREFTEDCTVGGYQVPKGTRLITNLWKIQTDPKMWEDPLEFKPERFLTTHKDVDYRSRMNFEYIPFGSGRRMCPGSSFALQMVNLTLAAFLHAFQISTPSDAPVDMTENFGLTNVKATPLHVLINPCLPSKLYA